MTPFQLLALPLLIALLISTLTALRRGAIPQGVGAAWLLLWLSGAVLIARPDLSSAVASWAGIGRGVDLVVYLAVLVLFVIVLRLVLRQRQLERELTLMVRELALLEARLERRDDEPGAEG